MQGHGLPAAGRARTVAALLVGLLVIGMTGCGPRTVRTWLAPETYLVSSTITFRDPDGGVSTQTQLIRCEIQDTTDAINGALTTRAVGEHHWRPGADGSIMIVGDTRPCPWLERPKRGQTVRAEPHVSSLDIAPEAMADTYVFDDVENPTRIDVYDTRAIFAAEAGPFDPPTLYTGRRKGAPALKRAFPGIRTLAPPVEGGAGGSYMRSDLSPGWFSGVAARVYQLAPGSDCAGGEPEGVVTIGMSDACRDIRDCARSEGYWACGRYIGVADIRLDDAFSRADISAPAQPDRLLWMRFYSNERIRARRAPQTDGSGRSGWNLRLCYEALCTDEQDVRFYDPKTDRLIWVSVQERTFAPTEFTSRPPR